MKFVDNFELHTDFYTTKAIAILCEYLLGQLIIGGLNPLLINNI